MASRGKNTARSGTKTLICYTVRTIDRGQPCRRKAVVRTTSGMTSDLAEIVEVVLVVDPAERRSFVEAIGLVDDVTDVTADAVVQHALEQLVYIDANDAIRLRLNY